MAGNVVTSRELRIHPRFREVEVRGRAAGVECPDGSTTCGAATFGPGLDHEAA